MLIKVRNRLLVYLKMSFEDKFDQIQGEILVYSIIHNCKTNYPSRVGITNSEWYAMYHLGSSNLTYVIVDVCEKGRHVSHPAILLHNNDTVVFMLLNIRVLP